MKKHLASILFLLLPCAVEAHDGHPHTPTVEMNSRIISLNTEPRVWLSTTGEVVRSDDERPPVADSFDKFINTKSALNRVKVRWDNDFLYVESKGMPAHSMMTGITAWQQQVPLPQDYSGENAWRIPLKPVPAVTPMSAKSHFFRGAIALAVNGVPIFNPIKNDGRTDTLLAGELDQWGGHCGRGDDYHYHIGPVHLEKFVGVGEPIGVALDGYLLYGYEDSENLDWLNGQKDENGVYHYHSTKTYPYINGGFFGQVVERGGQVDPQPRAQGLRPALRPLLGAKITEFENPSPGRYVLRYEVSGDRQSVEYTVAGDGSVKFNFVSRRGTTTETYSPRPSGGNSGRRNAIPPPRQDRRPVGDQMANQGSRPRRGEGDPIVKALDADGDGRINKAELRKAGASLRKLDKNNDGQITSDELRGPGGGDRGPQKNRAQGNEVPDQSGKPRGPQTGDSPRQPWILVHADEIDLDRDKIISRKEIVGEGIKAFEDYDANHDDNLSEDELSGRGGSRSAMGGFLKGHSHEIDRDQDGILTRTEAVGNAERMFAKMDRNGDGKIMPEEMEASRRK